MSLVIATFVGVLTIVLGAYWAFVLRPEEAAQEALHKRLRPLGEGREPSLLATEVRAKHRVIAALEATIERSGLRVTVAGFLISCAASGSTAGIAVWKATEWWPPAIWVGLCLAPAPYLLLRSRAAKRMNKFEEQFPEAMELIARALRAGHAFTTALSMVAEEIPSPVGPEFKLLYDRQNFGLPLPEALRALADRVPSIDTRFFVTAVLTQREAGGNLSAVLDNLASVIRDRFTIKRQVRTASAHGRMTAMYLTAMAPAMLLLQTWIAPANVALLFRDPLGVKMLAGAAILQLAGMAIIRRIATVKY